MARSPVKKVLLPERFTVRFPIACPFIAIYISFGVEFVPISIVCAEVIDVETAEAISIHLCESFDCPCK